MKILILSVLTILCRAVTLAQDANSSLSPELQAMHAQWFKAFEAGDGATMDQTEVENLVVVMPNGMAWPKPGPRAGKQPKRDPATARDYSDRALGWRPQAAFR
jgi:hypothetical protein